MSFETLVLRYRDLSTDKGETIAKHKQIIADRGAVWWGWWSKIGETVPTGAFQEVSKRIAAHGLLEVYLFDTGQYRLTKAKLAEVRWNHLIEPIASPDLAMTPAYYGNTTKLAWFRFEEMSEVALEEAELRRWTRGTG